MKACTLVLLLGVFALSCRSETVCTSEEKSRWRDQDAFRKQLVDEGFEIKEFKVTSGNCYEIYGWDRERRKVEIYFNPVTGDKVKEEIH